MNNDKINKELSFDLEIWSEPQREKFWMMDERGHYVQYSKGAITTRLKHEFEIPDKELGPLFAKIYRSKVVDFTTKIGGAKKGIKIIAGKNVLVPSEHRRIKPQKGNWSIISKYMNGMFGEEQFEWYKGWLQVWLNAFYNYTFLPGQVLICIGDPSSGKTLLKEIHNYIFDGGGHPLKYMTGGTGFNGELCEVCSLCIDDKLNDLGNQGKKKLKAECKELAVAGEWRFEFKNQTAFNASPIQRLLICCNYTEDSVSVIPDIDESTRNKISILQCERKQMPMPAKTFEEKQAFWNQIKKEIPAFIDHILNEHIITEDFADRIEKRMGVRGFHNMNAMKYVESKSNDGKRLIGYIEAIRKETNNQNEWEGSASDLVQLLRRGYHDSRATPTSMGIFLNQRIASGTKLVENAGHRRYRINTRDPFAEEEFETEDVKKSVCDSITPIKQSLSNQIDLLEDDENFYGDA